MLRSVKVTFRSIMYGISLFNVLLADKGAMNILTNIERRGHQPATLYQKQILGVLQQRPYRLFQGVRTGGPEGPWPTLINEACKSAPSKPIGAPFNSKSVPFCIVVM